MNSKKNPIPPIYMREDGRERIVAPFYQAGDLALDVVPLHGTQARLVRNWDCVQLRWDDCPANEPALGFTWVGLAAIAPYRTICFCLQAAESVALQVEVMVDGVWQCAHQEMGTGRRQEIWLPVNGQSLDRMRLTCIPCEGGRQIVTLYWLGLAMEAGQAGQPKSLRRYDPTWPSISTRSSRLRSTATKPGSAVSGFVPTGPCAWNSAKTASTTNAVPSGT